jgi:thioredoxin-dependent peroxiredoxin
VEAREFRDAHKKFSGADTVVVGISADKPEKQAKFKQKNDLPFTLLSDVDHNVAEAYGVWVQKSMLGKKYMGIARTTFLIDKQGKIAKVFEKVKPQGHADEVYAVCSLS